MTTISIQKVKIKVEKKNCFFTFCGLSVMYGIYFISLFDQIQKHMIHLCINKDNNAVLTNSNTNDHRHDILENCHLKVKSMSV